jgi:hypothetical protein
MILRLRKGKPNLFKYVFRARAEKQGVGIEIRSTVLNA